MREFFTRAGKFEGIHPVYDSYDEFRTALPIAKLWKWGQEDISASEVGDWIQAEDGFIVQLLDKYPMKTKAQVTFVMCYRFPQGTFGARMHVDGTIKYPQFYAMFTTAHKGSLSHSQGGVNSQANAKIRFAAMVMAGADPRTAYKSCMPAGKRWVTDNQLQQKIYRLFMDPIVGKEIQKHTKAFKDDITKAIPLSSIIDKIINHWGKVTPGSAQELKVIQFMMEVHDVVVTDEATGRKKMINKGDEIDANCEIEDQTPFPELGPKED